MRLLQTRRLRGGIRHCDLECCYRTRGRPNRIPPRHGPSVASRREPVRAYSERFEFQLSDTADLVARIAFDRRTYLPLYARQSAELCPKSRPEHDGHVLGL